MVDSVHISAFKDPGIKGILTLLSQVFDPEIPVVNVLELGIVRDVVRSSSEVEVQITPTYSGCPAIEQIETDIRSVLNKNGLEEVKVTTVLDPPWTTDMMWLSAKEKLKNYGIAPPCMLKERGFNGESSPNCPLCTSANVTKINEFSSAACKAIYRCNKCKEPFDYFKPH